MQGAPAGGPRAAMPRKRRAAALLLAALQLLLLAGHARGITKAKEAMNKVPTTTQLPTTRRPAAAGLP